MKKVILILIAGLLLSSCASSTVDQYNEWQRKNSNHAYTALACPANDINARCHFSAASYERDAKRVALKGCSQRYNNCKIFKINNRSVYTQTTSYNSGSTSYGNSYSSSNTNSQPQLFYDPNTGGMRECSHNALNSGRCLSFKTSLKTYTANTLFYNKSAGAMQPCMGTVNSLGQCSMFGLYNPNKVSKGQLFYDSRNNKMTTCTSVTVTGVCSYYDLVPNSWAKNSGGFRMTDPNNPYNKRVPRTPQQSIDVGMRMLSGGCTLGLNC